VSFKKWKVKRAKQKRKHIFKKTNPSPRRACYTADPSKPSPARAVVVVVVVVIAFRRRCSGSGSPGWSPVGVAVTVAVKGGSKRW
jgi:hypothetical protein